MRLEKLDLSQNDFNHSMESCWFWNITNLKYLDLSYNMLYGPIPNVLGDMTSLQVFKLLNDGGARCTMEPKLLRNLCDLEALNIYSLSYANMTEILESLMHCSNNKLREVYLYNNNLTGTLPTGMDKFTFLPF
uniref:Leucine-rich repeat-containing N-terminal plant-type domain-containing protein n=1 Tax=Oryza brachyantha TaxID=4533 RepID=J3N930_ORYBR